MRRFSILALSMGLLTISASAALAGGSGSAVPCTDAIVGGLDADGDGACTVPAAGSTLTDADFAAAGTFATQAAFEAVYGKVDCNDGSAKIRPGIEEIYVQDPANWGADDGIDHNCDSTDDAMPVTGPTLKGFEAYYGTQRVPWSFDRFRVEHERCDSDANCTVDVIDYEFDLAEGYLFVDLIEGKRPTSGILESNKVKRDGYREVVTEVEWHNYSKLLGARTGSGGGMSRRTADARYVIAEQDAEREAEQDDAIELGVTERGELRTDVDALGDTLGEDVLVTGEWGLDTNGDGNPDAITFDSVDDRVSFNERQTSRALSGVAALGGRLDTAEDDIDNVESGLRTVETNVETIDGSGFVLEATAGGAVTAGTEVTDPGGSDDNVRNAGSAGGNGTLFVGGETEAITAGAVISGNLTSDGGDGAGTDLLVGGEVRAQVADNVELGGGGGLWLSNTNADALHSSALLTAPAAYGVLSVSPDSDGPVDFAWVTRVGGAVGPVTMDGATVETNVAFDVFATTGIGIRFGTAGQVNN